MRAEIERSCLNGVITAPPSKSAGHRSLICAALSDCKVKIYNCGTSDDIEATILAITALGAEVVRSGNDLTVTPAKRSISNAIIDCCESGSTARFMLPVAAALGARNATFIGRGRLPQRPFEVLCDCLETGGVSTSSQNLPITVSGQLRSGTYTLPGNISSQYISGLLLALSVVPGTSTIKLTSKLESAAYVDMTVNELRAFGADITVQTNSYIIKGRAALKGVDRRVEGDWSQAAFFLSAGAILGDITVKGIDMNSLQGDKQIVNILKHFGADIETCFDGIRVKKSNLHSVVVDASQIPDLVPIIAVTAAFAEGETVITNAERLRIKESDRLRETAFRLREFGICAEETENGIKIIGSTPHNTDITSAQDHRIVMCFSILSSACEGVSSIDGAEAINKSYPKFFEDFRSLGGNVNVF